MAQNPSSSPPRLAALRYRDFRLLWIGQIISMIGSQMQIIAINWHIYELLRGQSYSIEVFGRSVNLGAEALGLGTLGLVRIIPIILFSLWGGIMADAKDRRRIMLWTQTGAALLAAILAFVTLTDKITVPLIYLLTALGQATSAFDGPARHALVPRLVPEKHLSNAISLTVLQRQIGAIAGPAIAGIMVASFNIGIVYTANALTFVAVIAALLLMNYRGRPAAEGVQMGWRSLAEGLRFTYRSRLIWSTMLLDFIATFFSSARTMLPIVAGDILKVGPVGYGILNTAQPMGAVLAGTIASLRKEIHHQGRVLLVSVAVYGLATALFGVSTLFAFSYALFGLTGAADTISTVIRGTLRQLLTPDSLRGRMSSVNMVFFMGGPQLGELEAGLVGSALGVPFAILSGGIATVLLTLWIAWKYPRLRNYTADKWRDELAAIAK